ncbi:MAG TPA: hypothetical protein VMN57_09060 [Anaerolineales bacterium]|nr:hypothetical protein [Anaerolineales bacterium]
MDKPYALIVEDDPDVAELYSHLMRLLGFSPETRSNDGTFFIMLYEVREPQNAAMVAERMIGILSEPFVYDGFEIGHAAAAGVAVSATQLEDPARLVALARGALNMALETGERIRVAPAPE